MAGGDNTELSFRINDLQVESAAKLTTFQQIETKKYLEAVRRISEMYCHWPEAKSKSKVKGK